MTFIPLEDPDSTRVIILPETSDDVDTYAIVQLPNPRTLQATKYLINQKTHQLLELKNFNYQNPHLPKNVVTTRDGQVVKSLVLSSENDGLVFEKPDFLIATYFNFVYLLISFYERTLEAMHNDENYKVRLLNLEDLIEYIESDKLVFGDLPRSFFDAQNEILISAIDLIFDVIGENGENYYKLSQLRIIQFLKLKVDKIVENFPASMLQKAIYEKLTPAPTPGSEAEKLGDDVVQAAKVVHAINIVSSYVSPLLSAKLSKIYETEVETVTRHKKYLQSASERQKLAEDNLSALNMNLKVEKRKEVVTKTTTVSKKKVVQKVAVGKGALDGFFKRSV